MVELNREYLVGKYGQENLFNLTEIRFLRKGITKIDSNTFKNLTKLERLGLSYNAIEEIDVRLFETLSNLKKLDLSNNKLKRIDFNTFKNLTKLERLWLFNNQIEEIDARLFESLSNLNELLLLNNNLKRIDSNTFKTLTKLEGLWLNGNVIEEIDLRLFESLSNLKGLWLYKNKLKRIDSNTFKNLKKLEYLSLSNNKIEDIDLKLFESLSNLKRLYLSNNKLKEIDRKCFESLKSIEMIDIYENKGRNAVSFIKPPTECWFDQNIGLFLYYRYKIKERLGKGSFGSVYLVVDTKMNFNHREKAMKIMDLLDSSTLNELELFSEIYHNNIVRYFDHFHMSIEGENKTFLITEYCKNGDLKSKIEEAQNRNRNFDERQILEWICQSTNALKYLHSIKPDPIIHRDIKPANMLLTERNEIKLADLGWSKIMDKTQEFLFSGSRPYMSPEVFKAHYYPNTDIWSLGCVLYELKYLTKAFPRGQFDDQEIPTKVFTSGIFSSVLPRMLEKDCLVRISSRRLLAKLEDLLDDENN